MSFFKCFRTSSHESSRNNFSVEVSDVFTFESELEAQLLAESGKDDTESYNAGVEAAEYKLHSILSEESTRMQKDPVQKVNRRSFHRDLQLEWVRKRLMKLKLKP